MVAASRPVSSPMRLAARPVGAVSSVLMPSASKSASMARTVVVLPVPGPPVRAITRLRAARAMAARSDGGAASPELCLLVVVNTASIQLLPTTAAALRASNGSAAPFDILPAVWLSSAASVTAGILAAKLFERLAR